MNVVSAVSSKAPAARAQTAQPRDRAGPQTAATHTAHEDVNNDPHQQRHHCNADASDEAHSGSCGDARVALSFTESSLFSSDSNTTHVEFLGSLTEGHSTPKGPEVLPAYPAAAMEQHTMENTVMPGHVSPTALVAVPPPAAAQRVTSASGGARVATVVAPVGWGPSVGVEHAGTAPRTAESKARQEEAEREGGAEPPAQYPMSSRPERVSLTLPQLRQLRLRFEVYDFVRTPAGQQLNDISNGSGLRPNRRSTITAGGSAHGRTRASSTATESSPPRGSTATRRSCARSGSRADAPSASPLCLSPTAYSRRRGYLFGLASHRQGIDDRDDNDGGAGAVNLLSLAVANGEQLEVKQQWQTAESDSKSVHATARLHSARRQEELEDIRRYRHRTEESIIEEDIAQMLQWKRHQSILREEQQLAAATAPFNLMGGGGSVGAAAISMPSARGGGSASGRRGTSGTVLGVSGGRRSSLFSGSDVVIPPSAGVPFTYFAQHIVAPYFESFFPIPGSAARGEARSRGKSFLSTNNNSNDGDDRSEGEGSSAGGECDHGAAQFSERRMSNVHAVLQLFRVMDINADGFVSWDEFSSYALQASQRNALEEEQAEMEAAVEAEARQRRQTMTALASRDATKKLDKGPCKNDDEDEDEDEDPSATPTTAAAAAAAALSRASIDYALTFTPTPTNRSAWQATFPLVHHLYHTEPMQHLILSQRSRRYVTGGPDGLVKLWRPDPRLCDSENRCALVHERNLLSARSPITKMVISPASLGDAEVVAVAAMDGTVTLLRSATGEVVRTLLGVRTRNEDQVAVLNELRMRAGVDRAMMEYEAEDLPSLRGRKPPVSGTVIRLPYTVRAYHSEAMEIFFGKTNRYFQGLDVVAPTYEHLKRPIASSSDILYDFGAEALTSSRRMQRLLTGEMDSTTTTSKCWFATALALAKVTTTSSRAVLSSGAYMFLGFEAGVVQVYPLNINWFSVNQLSATRVEPPSGKFPKYSVLLHEAAITQMMVSESCDFLVTASDDGTIAIRHLSKINAPFLVLGDGIASASRPLRSPSQGPLSSGAEEAAAARAGGGPGHVGHTKRLTAMCWNESHRLLVSGGMDHAIYFWTPRSRRPTRKVDLRDVQDSLSSLTNLGACGYPVDLSFMERLHDPLRLVVLDSRRIIRFLHALTGAFMSVLVDNSPASLALGDMLVARYEPHDDRLVLGGVCLRVWNVPREEEYATDYLGHRSPIIYSTWHRAMQVLVTADSEHVVMWKMKVEPNEVAIKRRRERRLARMEAARKEEERQRALLIRSARDDKGNGDDEESSSPSQPSGFVVGALVKAAANATDEFRGFSPTLSDDVNPFNNSFWSCASRVLRTFMVPEGIRAATMDPDSLTAGLFVALLRQDAIVQYNSLNGVPLRRFAFAEGVQDVVALHSGDAVLNKAEHLQTPIMCAVFEQEATHAAGVTALYHVTKEAAITAESPHQARKRLKEQRRQQLEITVEATASANIIAPYRSVLSRHSPVSSVTLLRNLGMIVIGGVGTLHVTPTGDVTSTAIPCQTLPEQAARRAANGGRGGGDMPRGSVQGIDHAAALSSQSVSQFCLPLLRSGAASTTTAAVPSPARAGGTALPSAEEVHYGESWEHLVALFPGRLVRDPVVAETRLRQLYKTQQQSQGSPSSLRPRLSNAAASSMTATTNPLDDGDDDETSRGGGGLSLRSAAPDRALSLPSLRSAAANNQRTGSMAAATAGGGAEREGRDDDDNDNEDFFTKTHAALLGFIGHLCPIGETGYLISGSNDGMLQLWNLRTSSEVLRFRATVDVETITSIGMSWNYSGYTGTAHPQAPPPPCLLAVGNQSGYVVMFDLSEIPFTGETPLDTIRGLEERVVVLDRWRAHRRDVRGLCFVTNPEVEVEAGPWGRSYTAAGESPRAAQLRARLGVGGDLGGNETAIPNTPLTLVTCGEDSYVHVWRWHHGSLHCLGCFGGGSGTPVTPPLLQQSQRTMVAFEAPRRHYVLRRLVSEKSLFASCGKHRVQPAELEAAVAFMAEEMRHLISEDPVHLLATWGSLGCIDAEKKRTEAETHTAHSAASSVAGWNASTSSGRRVQQTERDEQDPATVFELAGYCGATQWMQSVVDATTSRYCQHHHSHEAVTSTSAPSPWGPGNISTSSAGLHSVRSGTVSPQPYIPTIYTIYVCAFMRGMHKDASLRACLQRTVEAVRGSIRLLAKRTGRMGRGSVASSAAQRSFLSQPTPASFMTMSNANMTTPAPAEISATATTVDMSMTSTSGSLMSPGRDGISHTQLHLSPSAQSQGSGEANSIAALSSRHSGDKQPWSPRMPFSTLSIGSAANSGTQSSGVSAAHREADASIWRRGYQSTSPGASLQIATALTGDPTFSAKMPLKATLPQPLVTEMSNTAANASQKRGTGPTWAAEATKTTPTSKMKPRGPARPRDDAKRGSGSDGSSSDDDDKAQIIRLRGVGAGLPSLKVGFGASPPILRVETSAPRASSPSPSAGDSHGATQPPSLPLVSDPSAPPSLMSYASRLPRIITQQYRLIAAQSTAVDAMLTRRVSSADAVRRGVFGCSAATAVLDEGGGDEDGSALANEGAAVVMRHAYVQRRREEALRRLHEEQQEAEAKNRGKRGHRSGAGGDAAAGGESKAAQALQAGAAGLVEYEDFIATGTGSVFFGTEKVLFLSKTAHKPRVASAFLHGIAKPRVGSGGPEADAVEQSFSGVHGGDENEGEQYDMDENGGGPADSNTPLSGEDWYARREQVRRQRRAEDALWNPSRIMITLMDWTSPIPHETHNGPPPSRYRHQHHHRKGGLASSFASTPVKLQTRADCDPALAAVTTPMSASTPNDTALPLQLPGLLPRTLAATAAAAEAVTPAYMAHAGSDGRVGGGCAVSAGGDEDTAVAVAGGTPFSAGADEAAEGAHRPASNWTRPTSTNASTNITRKTDSIGAQARSLHATVTAEVEALKGKMYQSLQERETITQAAQATKMLGDSAGGSLYDENPDGTLSAGGSFSGQVSARWAAGPLVGSAAGGSVSATLTKHVSSTTRTQRLGELRQRKSRGKNATQAAPHLSPTWSF